MTISGGELSVRNLWGSGSYEAHSHDCLLQFLEGISMQPAKVQCIPYDIGQY